MKFLFSIIIFYFIPFNAISQDFDSISKNDFVSFKKTFGVLKLSKEKGRKLKKYKKEVGIKFVVYNANEKKKLQSTFKDKEFILESLVSPDYLEGLKIGLGQFKDGEKGYIYIPEKLGLGENTGDLIYYVEVNKK